MKGVILGAGLMAASLILTAGKGSRMKGFEGNKTLLPLVPGSSAYEGTHPILLHILNCLPPGPKALVVHHKKEAIMEVTHGYGLSYHDQPVLNGTGGALLAAKKFLEDHNQDRLVITMGDVPLVKESTYRNLVLELDHSNLVVLGFHPLNKKQYGVLETDRNVVRKITEWKYWCTYPKERQERLQICNSGIYAARKDDLLQYFSHLENRPHKVLKERNGKMVEVEEFFITDLVELMVQDGLRVGYVVAEEENEVMGVDDLSSLIKAQKLFKSSNQTGFAR